MSRLRRVNRIWILLVLCLALYLPGLSSLPATDRDESRYMQATHQMVDSGDFIDIRFQSDPRYKKPVGIYWLQAGMSQAARSLGLASTERAPYRLPSSIGATGAVLALYLGFRRLIGEREAFIGAVFLACTVVLVLEAHLAKTDAMQLATIVTMQAGLARVYCTHPSRGSWQARLLFWLGLGLGMLIKGPVAPTVACLTLATICWRERSFWPLRELQPWRWIALPILIVVPWLLSIQGLSDGQFVQDSLGRDFLAKILEGQESHGAPPGTYLLLTPFLLWPVSWLLIPGAWLGLHGHQTELSRFRTFAFAWLVPAWILFEVVPTKLPHYVLPLIPALCLLGGLGFEQKNPPQASRLSASRWPERIGTGVWVVSGIIITAGVPALSIWATGSISTAAFLASAACLATLTLAPRLQSLRHRLLASSAAAVVVFGLLFQYALPGLTPVWPAETIRTIIHNQGFDSLPVAIADYHEPSVVFNLGTDTRLTDLQGVAAHVSDHPQAIAIVPSNQARQLRLQLSPDAQLKTIGRVNGFNYTKGRPVELDIIYTVQANQPSSQAEP